MDQMPPERSGQWAESVVFQALNQVAQGTFISPKTACLLKEKCLSPAKPAVNGAVQHLRRPQKQPALGALQSLVRADRLKAVCANRNQRKNFKGLVTNTAQSGEKQSKEGIWHTAYGSAQPCDKAGIWSG